MELTALVSPFLVGASIIAILFPKHGLQGAWLVLIFSLGAGLGLGITSCTIFFWLTLIGPPDSYYFAVELSLAVILSLLAYYRIRRSADRTQTESGINFDTNTGTIIWLRNIFLILILISVGSFLLKAFMQDPHGKWDAIDTWNFRARWLFRGGADWSYAFSLRAKDGLDYPLLLTVSVFRLWQAVGKDLIAIPIFIAGIFTFGSYLLLFSSLALLRGRNQGYLAAIFLLVSTQFLNIGTYQYADVPLAFFILGAVFLFSLKDRYPELTYPIVYLAGLTVSCAAWTKNEGLLFLALVIFVYFIFRLRKRQWSKTFKELAGFVLGLTPVLSTLIYFKLNFALENAHIRANPLKQLGTYLIDIDRYIIVGTKWFDKFLTFNDGIVWLALAYFFFSGFDRSDLVKKRLLSPTVLLLLMMGGYFLVYVIYPGNPKDLLSASLRRVIIQLWLTWVFIFFYCVKGPERYASNPANPSK
ncbi:MAG: phospholipid carrier-dependent glycosyltransferase [bacterium]|nr:phospholipid carrier-dependent glycosyltransferase [bacterium]